MKYITALNTEEKRLRKKDIAITGNITSETAVQEVRKDLSEVSIVLSGYFLKDSAGSGMPVRTFLNVL